MSSNETVVQSALQLLAKSLDPYIEKVIAPHLGGELHWTDVLHQLDKIKGKSPKIYSHTDVQPQLRMVTERLGELGYPFSAEDPQRLMSVYGNELRLIRNRWAHGDSFSAMETMRATDTVFIVLTHIGDKEAAAAAADLRTSVIKELVSEPASEPSSEEDGESPDLLDAADPAEVVDEPEQAEKPETPTERFTGVRTTYEPWEIVVTGTVDTLDNLPKKAAKESVRATIEEIVDLEGPIHRDRLVRLVGYTYGLGKVHEGRVKKIAAQITGSGCVSDKDKFVWAADTDPGAWKIYRTSPLGGARAFLQISPVEIANASVDILRRKGVMALNDLRPLVLRTFGRRKATKGFTAHFEKALLAAAARGQVSLTNEVVSLPMTSEPVLNLQDVLD